MKLVRAGALGAFGLLAALTSGTAAESGSLLPPLPRATLTQSFGCTSLALEPPDPACPGGHFHSGVDLAVPAGTPVVAAASGIASVGWDPHGYGLYVLIQSRAGLSTIYAHLSLALCATGDGLQAGQILGLVGASGNATGPHLHFEVRLFGRPQNPLGFLPQGYPRP